MSTRQTRSASGSQDAGGRRGRRRNDARNGCGPIAARTQAKSALSPKKTKANRINRSENSRPPSAPPLTDCRPSQTVCRARLLRRPLPSRPDSLRGAAPLPPTWHDLSVCVAPCEAQANCAPPPVTSSIDHRHFPFHFNFRPSTSKGPP